MGDIATLEAMLGAIAHQGLAHADQTLLCQVAERLWYSHDVPNLAVLSSALRPDAGYLVDRLARYSVLSKSRKLRLITVVQPYKGTCDGQDRWITTCKDPLAREWGASSDLTCRMAELLPLQTRQYAMDKANARF